MSKKLNYGLINFCALMLLLYISFSNIELWLNLICKSISVMTPFIIGFVFAYAFTFLMNKLIQKGINKNFAIIIIVFGLVLLLIGLVYVTLPLIYKQFGSFVNGVLEFIDTIGNKFNINLGSYEIVLSDYLTDTLSELGKVVSSSTIELFIGSMNFISKFIVGFVGFIYFLADMDKIRKSIRELLLSWSKRAYNYIKCLDKEISNYLKGLLIFMVVQLFEYSILFFIVGHPYWLILGILASITTIVPYFGDLFTNLIAIFTATVVSVPLTIATIIICLIFPQLDGYVISPRIYGKTNKVNPLITIMVVSIGGTLFGIFGIVIALPTFLFLRTTYYIFKGDLKKGIGKVKKSM